MLLDPRDWSLAPAIDDVLAALPEELRDHVSSETHSSAVELRTGVHSDASATRSPSSAQLRAPAQRGARRRSASPPRVLGHAPVRRLARDGGLRRASATRRSTARCASSPAASRRSRCTSTSACRPARPGSRRSTACARTCRSCSRCRPTRRSGRAATPAWRRRARRCSRPSRASGSRARSAPTASTCARSTCCWTATRSPTTRTCGGTCARSRGSGTVEVRIMDAQSTLDATAALVALVQSLVRLELVDGHADAALVHAPEVLDENRFLAARDGVDAELVDPVRGRAVPVVDIVAELVARLRAARRASSAARTSSSASRDAARRRRPRAPAPARRARRPRRPRRRPRRGLLRRRAARRARRRVAQLLSSSATVRASMKSSAGEDLVDELLRDLRVGRDDHDRGPVALGRRRACGRRRRSRC